MVEVRGTADSPTAPMAAVAVNEEQNSYVDWPAILAGAAIASAIAFVLHTFGLAIGLTLTSPFEGEGIGATGLIIGIGIWIVWVAASSFMAGGYVAGRLRRRLGDATENEVDVRDGAHGLVVWAVGVLAGAFLIVSGAMGVANTAGSVVGAGAAAGAQAVDAADPQDIDAIAAALFRSDQISGARNAAPATDEARRIMSSTRGVTDDDNAYLARLVANTTGMTIEDAEARVSAALGELDQLEEEARQTAEVARKASVISAFVIAASLLIAAAGAYWAAGVGGRHRDENTVFKHFGRWR